MEEKFLANITPFIEAQFPAIYREEGDIMVQFLKAYYEFTSSKYADNRNITNAIDVDYTSEEFLGFFKETYLNDFPFLSATDTRFMVKHIVEYYRSKGTVESTKLLIRLLFNEESDVYFPSRDILKASDSSWDIPRYIEVSRNPLSATFINKQIIGSKSGAKAMVEGLVTKRVGGKYIDVLYLSNIRGFFVKNEKITAGGSLKNAPIVFGSLNSVTINNGGRNNTIGDIFDIVGTGGSRGKARISGTENATGRVDFELLNGGSGYTMTRTTDIFVSDAVLNMANPLMDFIRFEKVTQKMEDLKVLSVGDIVDEMEPGRYFWGVNEHGVRVANGTILDVTNRLEEGNPVADIKLLVTEGTFDRQERFELTSNVSFLPGEIIEEESTTILNLTDIVGTFNLGDRVEQAISVDYDTFTADITLSISADNFDIRETVVQYNDDEELSVSAQVINRTGNVIKVRNIRGYSAPGELVVGREIQGLNNNQTATIESISYSEDTTLYTAFAFGYIDSISGAQITLKPSWGFFEPGIVVNSYPANDLSGLVRNGSAAVQGVSINPIGARSVLSVQPSSNNLIVENIFGLYNVGNKIRGDKSKRIATVSSISNEGATDIWLDGNVSANGVIDTIANTTPIATVIAQNTSAIGVHGNTVPFFSSGQVSIEGSERNISNVAMVSGNNARLYTPNDHPFNVNDNIILRLDINQNNEIKTIEGIFVVTGVVDSTSFTVTLNDEQSNIIRAGNLNFFFTTVRKTVLVPIETIRSQLISPPRNINGEIIEVIREVYNISSGSDASFEIGSLENEETVFLATDIIGSNNVVGTPYLGVLISGANSGIGFVDSFIIDEPGSGYSNGQVITFEGGGFAGGDPLVPAAGIIMTDSAGQLIDVHMWNHGQGYWGEPGIVWPGGNDNATVELVMDYGYGFPKSPNGDLDTTLIDMWTLEPFTIGTITSLTSINPGRNYNQDPFVLVYNRFVAGFKRTDFLVTMNNVDGMFQIGETITEEIPGDGDTVEFAKGYVISATFQQIIVRRTSFNTSFTSGYNITGSISGATAFITSVESVYGSYPMGDNAEVGAEVIAADGIATELEITDSGFGYEDGEVIALSRPGTPYIMTGIASVRNQGVGTGYWKTKTSHLNSTSKVHDNRYYQEFSYDILAGKSIDKYHKIFKDILHVSGTAIFGTVTKSTKESLELKVHSSIRVSGNWFLDSGVIDMSGKWHDQNTW